MESSASTRGDIHGARLTIDLDAVVRNYHTLREQSPESETGAVVKANAYGLGLDHVAPALAQAGCTTFFVATVDEAIALRAVLPKAGIHVFDGLLPGWSEPLAEINAIPVLNSLYQINLWLEHQETLGRKLPADIHIDTGMARLGLNEEELQAFRESRDSGPKIEINTILSHLACSENTDHPLNEQQLAAFTDALTHFDGKKASLSASAGVFLGPEYHFDLTRPGIALFGGNPTPGSPNPMAQVIRLQGKILQVRSVDTPQTVGYGATHQASGPARIATVALGYADGYIRSLGNTGKAWIESYEVPVVGRVSMDLTTLDVSSAPDYLTAPGALVDFIGPQQSTDDVAHDADTISYEFLTGLGARFYRTYIGG